MKKHIILAILFFSGTPLLAQYPAITISNDLIEARLYLPDSKAGFYRGTRFDWSGIVSSLKYAGHEYFGQWYEQHDPLKHDAITGPVEAFDPIGYDEAAPGDTFLKIGVGTLRKSNTEPYRFSRLFEVVNPGNWKYKVKKDRVEFIHELQDKEGYSYIYKKTLKLVKGRPELILEHSLKNTGKKIIETNVFDHNFFVMDNQPTGPDFLVTLPFEIKTEAAKKELITFNGQQMRYLRELKKGESTMEYPKGINGQSAGEYDFRIENHKTGAAVRITSDRPMSSFMYWSVATTLSPEPFISIKALPGKKFKWDIKYEFYQMNDKTIN